MVTIMVTFAAFGLTVSERNTETLLMQAPEKSRQAGEPLPPPPSNLVIDAAGPKYEQQAGSHVWSAW